MAPLLHDRQFGLFVSMRREYWFMTRGRRDAAGRAGRGRLQGCGDQQYLSLHIVLRRRSQCALKAIIAA